MADICSKNELTTGELGRFMESQGYYWSNDAQVYWHKSYKMPPFFRGQAEYFYKRCKSIDQIAPINEQISMLPEKDLITDGSHTFDELYFHRMILFAALCKKNKYLSWKSKLHEDGTMFKDYFIVGIDTPEGTYSYHYHMQYWDHFDGIREYENAPEWDGHKPEDVTRLLSL